MNDLKTKRRRGGGQRGEKVYRLRSERVRVTPVMWLWRVEHPGNHRRQVLIGGANWLTREVDQIYRETEDIFISHHTTSSDECGFHGNTPTEVWWGFGYSYSGIETFNHLHTETLSRRGRCLPSQWASKTPEHPPNNCLNLIKNPRFSSGNLQTHVLPETPKDPLEPPHHQLWNLP